jgi:hypothetical protein
MSENKQITTVFVPYSPRSFAGICSDVRSHIGGDVEIVALVVDWETPPEGMRSLKVAKTGNVGLYAIEVGPPRLVVANGGMTCHTIAALHLARRMGCRLINLQQDGVVEMQTESDY